MNISDYIDYKAFNVVGLVAAADMRASTLMGTSEGEMIDADFDRLVIDESRAAGFKLFRLAENVSAIIVDDEIRRRVEESGIPGLIFYESGEWSG